ncbi:hypothetical protein [Halovivax gelatinilyticus]|uniref:hypothetical protein n=1 Tax=Halovivax gelatinilyticus TaxID=2961597 RepID=UPI0020CA8650|nr:hypothetical protein [Halovivax gelatinilyticus]
MADDSDFDENVDPLESYGASLDEHEGPVGRFREWVLLDGARLYVATLLTVVVFVGLLVLESVGAISFTNDDSITRMAGGMIAGTFSLVTLVVSINQLILSREFTAAGEAESQLDGVESFRENIADLSGVPAAPASPARLLELLAETIDGRAHDLGDAVADHDESVRTPVRRYAAGVSESADQVDARLEETAFGTFETLSVAVTFDDGWYRYAGLYLQREHADALSETAGNSLDDVLFGLRLFAIAQEHFKTTYLQRELTRFSQLTIVTGVPAILSAMLIGFLYADLTGPTVTIAALPVVVSALVAVVISPLALLVAYILRTTTVTRRTASTGPMLPQKHPEEGPFAVTSRSDEGSSSRSSLPDDE